jgi:Na+/H+ antiporter NhaD/arsenite permease-like protein
MPLTQISIAAVATALVAARPRSWAIAIGVALLAALEAALSGAGSLCPALVAAAPMVAVLIAAVLVAGAAVKAGLPAALATALHQAAGENPLVLFALVCVVTAGLTAAATLDGAVVLMAPVVVELSRRAAFQLRPLVLGVVAVANCSSLGLPEGNPTNLVIMQRLGLRPWHTPSHTLFPALAATALCAATIAWRHRRSLRATSGPEIVAAHLSAARGLNAVGRTSVQVVSLLAVLTPLARYVRPAQTGGLGELLLITLACSALAALVNNLPASTLVAVAVGSGLVAYAALAGLSIGALATRQGSVATLIAGDLTGTRAHSRVLTPVAFLAALTATLLIWAGAQL